MRLVRPADGVIFADEKIEEAFNFLLDGNWLKKGYLESN